MTIKCFLSDQETSTAGVDEPPNQYVYLPPDDWRPGPAIMQADDQQPQMKKVLTRKTTKYHYHYKMTKSLKPTSSPSARFPIVPIGNSSNMAAILKQNQHRKPSSVSHAISKQSQNKSSSTMANSLKRKHNVMAHDGSLELRTDQIKLPEQLNPLTFYNRAGMLEALSKMAPAYQIENDVAQDLSKSTSTVTNTAWANDMIKVKEEPMTDDVDEHVDNLQNHADSDAESEQSLIKKSFTLPSHGNVKGYQPSELDLGFAKESLLSDNDDADGIDDEYLMQYFLTGKAAAMNLLGKLVSLKFQI